MAERLFVRLHDDPVRGPESDVPLRSLLGIAVPASHQAWVSNALAYDEQLDPAHEVVERVLPDGAARLIYLEGGHDGGGSPTLVLAGPTLAPVLVKLQGRARGVSITLMPGAAMALFGVPARQLVDRAMPLRDLWPREAPRLEDRLAVQPGLGLAAHELFAVIARRAAGRADEAARVAAGAVRIMQARAGMESPRAVAQALGLGERRLQQVFHDHVGLTPKAFARLARMQGLLRALRHDAAPAWAELAPDLGFYDQAHLANEFRTISGLCPREFLARSVAHISKTARG
jgi:AraC-like DNA-binding protein